MKILHVSDLHYNLNWFDWLARSAPNYDLLCIAGDLLDAGRPDIISEQIQGISAAVRRIAITTPIAICSGNHDLEGGVDVPSAVWMHQLRLPMVWVDGNGFKIGRRHFLCHSWLSPLHAADVEDIWIIHAPPEGAQTSLTDDGDLDHGDFEFSELCKSGRGPAIALCGHIHKPRSWYSVVGRTLILNPGESPDSRIPAHIIIDLEQGMATWNMPGHAPKTISLPGRSVDQQVLKRRTSDEIESLLALTVINQRAEGIQMTAAEIEETRRRLRRLAQHE